MTERSRILFIFVDGIGLGLPDSRINPFEWDWSGFGAFSGGRRWTAPGAASFRDAAPGGASGAGSAGDDKPLAPSLFKGIDACLGVEGLPQSGTGQATLFTGVNCAELAGRHYGPFPHSATRSVLRERSLFARIGAKDAAFANAYPPRFFEWVKRTRRWPTTTRACLDAGVRIRTIEDLEAGLGIAADVTGRGLAQDLGLPVSVVSPETAANRLLSLAGEHRFTMMEVFHTDKAGHAQSLEAALRILEPLDRLLGDLAAKLPSDVTLVLTSDHGNLEDLSVKSHTRNEVPLAVLGDGARHFTLVSDLAGVAPAIEAAIGPLD